MPPHIPAFLLSQSAASAAHNLLFLQTISMAQSQVPAPWHTHPTLLPHLKIRKTYKYFADNNGLPDPAPAALILPFLSWNTVYHTPVFLHNTKTSTEITVSRDPYGGFSYLYLYILCFISLSFYGITASYCRLQYSESLPHNHLR